MAKEKTQNKIHIKNKRVSFEYFVIDTYTAGIVLTGTEIKSIREGKASLADSYCTFKNNELFVIGMHIAEYSHGTYNNHDPKRERKLLLTRRELNKLKTKSNEKGFTIVPTEMFININEYLLWCCLVEFYCFFKTHPIDFLSCGFLRISDVYDNKSNYR